MFADTKFQARLQVQILFNYNKEGISARDSFFLVGVTGFEPATSCSQSRRAANCATPRYNYRLLNCFDKMVKSLLCSPGLRNCCAALCLARIALFRCASSTSLYLPPAAVGFVTQSRRAANCATPRYNYRLLNCFDKMVKSLLCSPGLRNCCAALCLARIALFRCKKGHCALQEI